jgi:hypothetical protein
MTESRPSWRAPAARGASIHSMNYDALPGGDLVRQGLTDLARRKETVPALLVSIGSPRLRRIGIPVLLLRRTWHHSRLTGTLYWTAAIHLPPRAAQRRRAVQSAPASTGDGHEVTLPQHAPQARPLPPDDGPPPFTWHEVR